MPLLRLSNLFLNGLQILVTSLSIMNFETWLQRMYCHPWCYIWHFSCLEYIFTPVSHHPLSLEELVIPTSEITTLCIYFNMHYLLLTLFTLFIEIKKSLLKSHWKWLTKKIIFNDFENDNELALKSQCWYILLISNKIDLETKVVLEIKWNHFMSFYWRETKILNLYLFLNVD